MYQINNTQSQSRKHIGVLRHPKACGPRDQWSGGAQTGIRLAVNWNGHIRLHRAVRGGAVDRSRGCHRRQHYGLQSSLFIDGDFSAAVLVAVAKHDRVAAYRRAEGE